MWLTANLVNEECLWSWGSLRLIGGVPGTEGVQNVVGLEEKGGEIQERNRGKGKKNKERKRRNKPKRKERRFSTSEF